MKLQMKRVTQKFKLDFDPEGLSFVEVRQATNGDEVRIAAITEEQAWRNSRSGKGLDLVVKWNPREQERFQAFLTLVGADLEAEDDKGATASIFRFKDGKNGPELAMTENEFNKAWDSLPAALCDEIVQHIYEANPQWKANKGE